MYFKEDNKDDDYMRKQRIKLGKQPLTQSLLKDSSKYPSDHYDEGKPSSKKQ